MTYTAHKFLKTLRTISGAIKMRDLKVSATPKGNWLIFNKGKELTIIEGALLDEKTIDRYNLKF